MHCYANSPGSDITKKEITTVGSADYCFKNIVSCGGDTLSAIAHNAEVGEGVETIECYFIEGTAGNRRGKCYTDIVRDCGTLNNHDR
jgi:hypothetical protein